ncbi:MAG: ferredoxin reductase family protein [Candidatus Magasanikiibacteriota bacterium]
MKRFFLFLLFIANLAIVVYFWWVKSGSMLFDGQVAMLISLGRITGLLAVFFILLQLILIGRVKWVEQVFGFDKLSIWHHWCGIISYIFILAHPIFLGFGYGISSDFSFLAQMIDFLFNWDDLAPAFLSVFLFTLIVITSIIIARWSKRMKYEKFYFVHLTVYVAILMAFGHQLELGGDFRGQILFTAYWMLLYIFAAGNLIAYRFLLPIFYFYKHQFTVDRVVRENDQVVSIYITGKDLEKYKIKAGQFCILRFFDKKNWWQAHPFSISAVPDGKYLRFTIKNLGDFSSEIGEVAIGTKVFLDGPNGIFTADRAKHDKVLAIAGGVGITPVISLVEEAGRLGKDIILLYGEREQKDIIFRQELDDLSQVHKIKVHYILTGDNNYSGEKGRIDKEKILRLVPDIKDRDIYMCGPWPMMKGILKIFKELSLSKNQVHYEKFSLGS